MIDVFGASFQNPVLLAAGTAGFGREVAGVVDLDELGGVITKAVSPEPRAGNPSPRVAEFPGGMLNSVGLANPGLEHVCAVELPWLEEHLERARVIVNVVGSTPDDYVAVTRGLRDWAVVTALELNVSCPNAEQGGEEFGANQEVLATLVRGCADVADKPVIVKLSPALPDVAATAEVAAGAGARGFSLVNTMPSGLFQERYGELPEEAMLGAGAGGVSGPALLPLGVLATRRVHQRTGLPVIGIGGIRVADDVTQYLEAGATLVGVGTAFLTDPRCPQRLAAAWRKLG